MKYNSIVLGRFVKRLNRFIAEVAVDGYVEKVHVKNTGRCKELFIEGVTVYLEESDNPNRKTKYSLIGIYKGNMLINIDSQAPNAVIYDALVNNKIKEIQNVTYAKREVRYGDSRFDIYYETKAHKGFIEVKGVTLEVDGMAMFPDAPTTRGSKHVLELTEGLKEGYKNYICFLIQMEDVIEFRMHYERDLPLAKNVYNAIDTGIGLLVYNSIVTKDTLEIGEPGEFLRVPLVE